MSGLVLEYFPKKDSSQASQAWEWIIESLVQDVLCNIRLFLPPQEFFDSRSTNERIGTETSCLCHKPAINLFI